MSEPKHKVTTIDHRGNEAVLNKPLNESSMTEEQKREWHKEKHDHLLKIERDKNV